MNNRFYVSILVEYLQLICYPSHLFSEQQLPDPRHRCRICKDGRIDKKLKCFRCHLQVHPRCKSEAPLPCIYATPMTRAKPNIQNCVGTPSTLARIPALLIKCFYELQKQDRILQPGLYQEIIPDPEIRENIKKLSEKLRRSTNQDLTGVATQIIACCVKDFLEQIRDQLLGSHEQEFEAIERNWLKNNDLETAIKQVKTELSELPVGSRETIAALIIHLHQINKSSPSYENAFLGPHEKPGERVGRLLQCFCHILKPIWLLYRTPVEVWRDMLRSTSHETRRTTER